MSNIIPMPDRATDNPPNCAAEQLRRASADVTCACPFRGQPNGIELYDEDGFDDDDVFETSPSRTQEFHPRALTDPYETVSRHTARATR